MPLGAEASRIIPRLVRLVQRGRPCLRNSTTPPLRTLFLQTRCLQVIGHQGRESVQGRLTEDGYAIVCRYLKNLSIIDLINPGTL